MEFPQDFTARERALLGARFDELYAYATPQPARGVTVNALRCTPEWFAQHADFDAKPSPFCPTAFTTAADFRPGRHAWHHAGVLYAQESSASAPAALLDVQPGMRVADLCAAPGGKTSQLAAALQGQGLLLANEFVAARAEILRQNLERMGVTNAVITNEDTARLAAAMPGQFDRVLVDAPCSGEGMFRKEAVAAAQHNNALVAHCAELGAEILENAAALLAPGGVLVYSTCTFAPAEDEEQIAAFLAKHPAFTLCDLSGCGFGRPGEANRAPDYPDFRAGYTRRIWPADGGEGHFMAKLQKAADADAPTPPKGKPPKALKAPAEWLDFAKTYFPALASRPLAGGGGVAAAARAGQRDAEHREAARRARRCSGGQRAEKAVPACPCAFHGLRRTVHEPRGADADRPAHRRLAAGRGDRRRHRAKRLVRRARRRVPARRRQGQRRTHQKPLPEGPAQSAIKRAAPLEKNDLLCYNNLLVIIGCNAAACVNTN